MSQSSDSEEESFGTREILRVVIDGEEYAFPVEETETVIDWKEPTPVPKSNDAVDGLVEVRGEIAVVITPEEFLSTEGAAEEFGIDDDVIVSSGVSSEQPVLIMDEGIDSQRVGFIIDSVIGVAEYDESLFRDSSTLSDSGSIGVETGVITHVLERESGSVLGVIDSKAVIENAKEPKTS